jgi:hypothetical protein
MLGSDEANTASMKWSTDTSGYLVDGAATLIADIHKTFTGEEARLDFKERWLGRWASDWSPCKT